MSHVWDLGYRTKHPDARRLLQASALTASRSRSNSGTKSDVRAPGTVAIRATCLYALSFASSTSRNPSPQLTYTRWRFGSKNRSSASPQTSALARSAPSLIEKAASFAGLRKTVSISPASRRSAIGKLSPAIVTGQLAVSFPDRRSAAAIACALRQIDENLAACGIELKSFRMDRQRDIGDPLQSLDIDCGQTAAAIADHDLTGGAVDADIVGILTKINPPGRRVICSREDAHRSVTRICDVKRVHRRHVCEALAAHAIRKSSE